MTEEELVKLDDEALATIQVIGMSKRSPLHEAYKTIEIAKAYQYLREENKKLVKVICNCAVPLETLRAVEADSKWLSDDLNKIIIEATESIRKAIL